jgi:hypothetical protein
LAVDLNERVYVSDGSAHEIRAYSRDGAYLETTVKYGAGLAEARTPWGLACGPIGELYYSDSSFLRLQKVSCSIAPTAASSSSPTPSATPTATVTPSNTQTSSSTQTFSPTASLTPIYSTPTATRTFSATPTAALPTGTVTFTNTPVVPSPTITRTPDLERSGLDPTLSEKKFFLGPVPAHREDPVYLASDLTTYTGAASIYNFTGQVVAYVGFARILGFSSTSSTCFDTTSLAAGIYLARLQVGAGDGSVIDRWQKIVILP